MAETELIFDEIVEEINQLIDDLCRLVHFDPTSGRAGSACRFAAGSDELSPPFRPSCDTLPDDGCDEIKLGELTVRVASPKMLYLMKKDTVRPQDRVDAERLRETFDLGDE